MASSVIPLPAEPREQLGTRTTRRLRAAGKLPAIVYGHGQAATNVTVPAKPFNEALNRGAHVFELTMNGAKENALLKDVQYDHLGMHILHVDFARVDLNEKVTITVSIELKGDAPGEKVGGITQQILNDIEVTCVVTNIPSSIVYNVGNLQLDGSVHVSDLKLPDGVTTDADPEQIVAICQAISEDEIADETAAVAEPEVIGAKPAEGDEAAAAEAK